MKKSVVFTGIILCAMVFIPCISAQTGVRGQSINGSTGLFSIPSGHIGWENEGNLAPDIGYRALINGNNGTAHIPALTISLNLWKYPRHLIFSRHIILTMTMTMTKKTKIC